MSCVKGLLAKYLWINMGTIAVSFVILGIMLLSFVINYWESEKSKIYFNDAEYISNIISNNSIVEKDNLVLVNSESVKMFMDTLSLDMGVDIFSADKFGNVIVFSSAGNGFVKSEFNGKIPPNVLQEVDYNQKMELVSLGTIYDMPRYVIRQPIYVLIGRTKTVIGSVFMVIDSKPFNDFRKDLFKIFLFGLILALLISFLAVRKVCYSVVRPIKEISSAAGYIAGGDFSKRVHTKNNDEIGELCLAFNNMAKSLDASDIVRKNFIANVSHEFKTPMTTISGFVNAILDGIISKETQDKYLKIILSEIDRLSRLVRMMLDLSKIDNESVPLHCTEFSIRDIILNIFISFESKLCEKNITVKGLDEDNYTNIYADKDMFYQAMYNLIENAIKFADNSGYIKISCLQENNDCLLMIENSGAGIQEKDIDFIFDRFYKTDKSRSQDKTGFGLGLYIVKRIIRLHGGSIKVQSKVNKFTRFKIRIPKTRKPK